MDNKKPAAKLEFSYQLRHARLDRASMVIRICHHNRLRRVIPLGLIVSTNCQIPDQVGG